MNVSIMEERDSFGGSYYKLISDNYSCRFDEEVEMLDTLEYFCCSSRINPFFMKGVSGNSVDQIPKETQWLGVKHKDGSYSVYFSIVDEKFRSSLYGKNGCICAVAITGDERITDRECYAFYKISGKDFYGLIENAAASYAEKFKTVSLRVNKRIPEFADYFGWCTWDSFYEKVTQKDVLDGLQNFKECGFVPKLLILDDGWQTVNSNFEDRGKWKLSDFKANEKFDHQLSGLIGKAKNEYGVKKFMVWHAVQGYWGGIDTAAVTMQKYKPKLVEAIHSNEMKEVNETYCNKSQFSYGIVEEGQFYAFYDDYYTYLEREGVDGVKVDVQSALEEYSHGRGGRGTLLSDFRNGLEDAVCRHFDGNMINCMSCSNDIIYRAKYTNIMRSSSDFFPLEKAAHRNHVYTNAINSIWMGQFTVCDWDMFQTTHEYAFYHAAARAVSGGPIYVSDRVGEHNMELIRSLTDEEGKVLKAEQVAMPTVDSLFVNPYNNKGILKVYNKNLYGGVIGAFALDDTHEQKVILRPRDVRGYEEGEYAVYSFKTQRKVLLCADDAMQLSLIPGECDVITLAPVKDNFAIVGLMGKLNGGAAIRNIQDTENGYTIDIADAGELLIYSRKKLKVKVEETELLVKREEDFVMVTIPKKCTINVML